MSLTQELTSDNHGQVYYTIEEEELLQAMDPSYISNDYNELTQPKLDNLEMTGGFAQALLPLIPALAPLIPQVINGIAGLFRKKGAGELNLPMLHETMKGYKPQFIPLGEGKRYYHNLIKEGENCIKSVCRAHDVPVSRYEIKDALGIPRSFRKIIKTSKSGSGKSVTPMPIVKWSLNKLFNDENVYKYLKPQIKELIRNDPEMTIMEGGSFKSSLKSIFGKTKSFLKKHLPTILKTSSIIGHEVLPKIVPRIGPALDTIFEKIETKAPPILSPVIKETKNIVKDQADKILTEDNMDKILDAIEKRTRGEGIASVKGGFDLSPRTRVGGPATCRGNGVRSVRGGNKKNDSIHIQLL